MFMGMLVSLPLNVAGLQQRLAQAGKIVFLGHVVLRHGGQIGIPAGGGELLAFARRQRHEHIDLVAARIHDGDQPLAHLLLLVAVDLERHAGELLEIGLVGQQRLRHRVVVGEEGDGLALEFLPVEIGRVRLCTDGDDRENRQRDMRRKHPGVH